MKKFSVILMMIAIVAMGCFAADPAEGIWKSIDDKTGEVSGIWKIWVEGDTLYGTLAALVDDAQDCLATKCKESYKGFPKAGKVNEMKVVGTPWIFGMKKTSEGVWEKGNIIDPGKGSIYGCKIVHLNAGDKNKNYTAKEETLAMAGVVGPIQVFQYWVKGSQADIDKAVAKFPPKK